MKFDAYLGVVDEKQDVFCGVSDALWDEPELGFDEFRAVEHITAVLEREGFRVERCVAGMSQAPCVAQQQSIPGKDKNHSCGYNLFAGGSLAAAVAGTLIRLLEDTELIAKARGGHAERVGEGCVCGVPDDVQPEI